jgi:hypothetical protein
MNCVMPGERRGLIFANMITQRQSIQFMKKNLSLIVAAFALLLSPRITSAQAPTLGSTAGFVLFSTNGAVTNSGISHFTGNIGTNNGSNTGFGNVNGVMNSANVATSQAAADLLVAYNQLNAATPDYFPSNLMGNGDTLTAGVYSIPAATVFNGILTLDAEGNTGAVFIFKIEGAFSSGPDAKVKLINGAKACNAFWKVEGLVSLSAGTTMRGTIIANNAAINMNTGDTLEGRAFSTTGAVIANGIFAYTPIGCGSPTLSGPAAPVLESTSGYALFTSDGQVSNTGITHVNGGDVGSNNGTTTGFDSTLVTGTIHYVPDSSTARCDTDLVNIYSYIDLIPHDIELLYPAQFGNNLVLTPHTYLLNAATILTDTLYLDAQNNPAGVFVIRINGAFLTGLHSRVMLINGAQAQNVFWRVDGATTISDFSVFNGTILVNNGNFNTGSIINGRVLSIIGALHTLNATINVPGAPVTIPDLIISTTTGAEGTYNNVTVTATGNGTLTANLVVLGNMVVQTGGRINTADNLIQGNNGFTLSAGATLTIHSTNGITSSLTAGDIQVLGTRMYDPAATYIYAGNVVQKTGDGLPAAIDSLVIRNSSGVSLSAPLTVSQKLTLSNGNLHTGIYDLTIASSGTIEGASASSYVAINDSAGVSGTLKRTVTSAGPVVLFPVGSNIRTGSYTPARITMPSGTTDTISVGVFSGVWKDGYTGAPVTTHAVNRSWIISEATPGGSTVTVELQWDDSLEMAPFNRTRTGIAHYSGGSWNTPSTYNAAAGSGPYRASRSGITSFSIFIAGDSTIAETLPVTLLSFSGTKINTDAVLAWKTAAEINNSHFEVERSTDGYTYQVIGTRKGAGNSSAQHGYTFIDANIVSMSRAVIYYRLTQVDFDGNTTAYAPVAIRLNQPDVSFTVTTYPNPIENEIRLQIVNSQAGNVNIVIYNMEGSAIAHKSMTIEQGMTSVSMDNLDVLPGGVYVMYATLNGEIFRQKLVKASN